MSSTKSSTIGEKKEDRNENSRTEEYGSNPGNGRSEESLSLLGGGEADQLSDSATLFHLLKGNIGIGVLSIPSALLNAGIGVGCAALCIIALISAHCMHLLIRSKQVLDSRFSLGGNLDFGEVVRYSLLPHSKPISVVGERLINVFILITQLGTCTVYILFIATSIDQLCREYLGTEWSLGSYILVLWLPTISVTLIRNLKVMAPFSALATILEFFSLAVVFYYIFRDPLPPVSSRPAYAPIEKFPLFFGTAIFTFEGIAVVLPLENKMKTPSHFGRTCGVLNIGMLIVGVLYLATGFFGYLKYGEQSAVGAITLNLPQEEILANSARIAITLAIFLSYPLQFYVAITILSEAIDNHLQLDSRKKLVCEIILRVLLVSLTILLAATVPYLDLFISLSGALCMTTLSLIAPVIIDTANFWESITWLGLAKNGAIFVVGVAGTLAGTIVAIQQIMQNYQIENPL